MPVFDRLTAFGFAFRQQTYRYLVIGDTRKPVVVLLSGYTHAHSAFSHLAVYLQKHYCVIVPDLPGWETPSHAPLIVPEYAAYLSSLLDFLGLKSIHLVAHCAGNAVAVEFASIYPQRLKDLFLVSVPHVEGILALPTMLRNSLSSKVKSHVVKQSFHPVSAMEKYWDSYAQLSFHKISRLPVTVHLIHGGNDAFVRPHKVKQLKRSAKVTFDVVLGSGHMPSVERPESLAAVILSYLH